MERLLTVKDLRSLYGLSENKARKIMMAVKHTNIGMGSVPRWVTTASAVDAYLDNRSVVVLSSGLDKHGHIIRR